MVCILRSGLYLKQVLDPQKGVSGTPSFKLMHIYKLRTSFDFEKALSREVGIKINRGVWVNRKEDTGVTATWSQRILDAVAGEGTTASAIFELKESGLFRGAKHRLRFENDISDSEERTAKHQKMTGMEELINNLSISSNGLPRTKDRK